MLKRNKFDELKAYRYGFAAGLIIYATFWAAVIGTLIHFIHKWW
jgi:hypothetical protein